MRLASLLFEYTTRYLTPFEIAIKIAISGFKIDNIDATFIAEKITVRDVKLLMNHWLQNDRSRFKPCYGTFIDVIFQRCKDDIGLGLYERKPFLQSCEPSQIISVSSDYLMAGLLVEILSEKIDAVKPASDLKEGKSSTDSFKGNSLEVADVANNLEGIIKAKNKIRNFKKRAAAKRKKDREKIINKQEITAVEDVVLPFVAAAAEFDVSLDMSFVDKDEGKPDILDHLDEKLLTPKAEVLSEKRKRSKSISLSPTRIRVFRHSAPPSPEAAAKTWQVKWSSDRVKDEYLSELRHPRNSSHMHKFNLFTRSFSNHGVPGIQELGIEKLKSVDNLYKHELSDELRLVFSLAGNSIIFYKGIKHYRGMKKF